jgi:hypothetical protein
MKNLLLALGAAVIVAAAARTLTHLTDHVVATVLVPGVVVGIALIVIGMRLGGGHPSKSGDRSD